MDTYQQELTDWRQLLDANLRKENSWLALAGLYWLEEGPNSFGANPGNKLAFPVDSGPDRMGTILVDNARVTLHAADGVQIKVDGRVSTQAELLPDTSEGASLVTVGSLSFSLIQREQALAIRLWDNSRPQRRSFPGRQWFPIQEGYLIPGAYRKYAEEHLITLQRKNASDYESALGGEINFAIDGRKCSLVVFEESEGELFTLFHDLSNGTETYSSGRYLVLDPPREGKVTLDFNRAYNPPCAFTPYATCPLPPPHNRLDLAILAGEKKPLNWLA